MTHTLIEPITYGYGDTIFTEELEFKDLPDLNYRNDIPREAGVYILYGKDDSVLYIGETKNLRKRLGDHITGQSSIKRFYKEVVAIKYVHTDFEKSTRTIAEGILVEKYSPKYNYDDIAIATSRDLTEELLHDVIFYAREHRLKAEYVAEKLGVTLGVVNRYATGNGGKTIQLPKGFKPTVLLDLSKQRNTKKKEVFVTEEMFHEISALAKKGLHTLAEIGEMFGVSYSTVRSIKTLKYKKYRQWSEGKSTTV